MRTLIRATLRGTALILILSTRLAAAEGVSPIRLPAPQMDGGKPIMQALKERRSQREFKRDNLPWQTLGNLLWAAFGINRPQTGFRTAPSAMNSQEISIYVALPQGLYLYEAEPHQLRPITEEDVRPKTSGQPFATNAPATLIFVADLARLNKAKPEQRPTYAAIDTGCISQNVYLFCASEGLATVVHELDHAALSAAMNLGPEQKIILAQAVGYPAEGKAGAGK